MRRQKGIALIIVLLVVALLSVIILEFVDQVQLQKLLASNLQNSVRSFYIAKSGVYLATRFLVDDLNSSSEDHLGEPWAYALPTLPIEGVTLKVTITDEEGKFNINRLVMGPQRLNTRLKDALSQLFTALNLDVALVDAIIDWVDEDSSQLSSGADENSAYGYGTRIADYLSKNAEFDTLEELRLVAGFNDQIFAKVEPYLTIWGTNKININTADPLVIQALINSIDPNADQTLGQKIAEYRLTEPFRQARLRSQLTEDLGIPKPLANRIAAACTTRSRYFKIKVEVKSPVSVVYSEAVVKRSKQGAEILWWKIR